MEWVPFPFRGDRPDSGIKPGSPALEADSLPAEPQRKPQTFLTVKYLVISNFMLLKLLYRYK